MTTFLFWNNNKQSLLKPILNITRLYDIDVLMFVEFSTSPSELLYELNSPSVEYQYVPKIGCEKIELFVKFPSDFIPPIYEESRITVRNLILPGLTGILLAIVHLPSKLNWSAESQSSWINEIASEIRKLEGEVGHSRTVLVGDFNMNPFEGGVVSAMGLHGVMTKRLAERGHRTVSNKQYPFFYNPMWEYFGDKSSVPGTYYYNNSEPIVYFWNIFDQVLIRPELLPRFDNRNLQILTSDGEISFLTDQGIPNSVIASDHLPLLFTINL